MTIRTERRGHLLVITIDRPEAMNALAPEMMFQLEDAFTELRDESELRAAVITGAGERAFCAGADLGRMADRAVRADPRRLQLFNGLQVKKPIVGAINGHCLAGGLGVALLCDVRIASENATFGCMGTARGILPGAGQTVRLPHVVGITNAMWLLLSGERIPASEALRIGLVNRVVAPGEALNAGLEWAGILASRAPLAVQATKESALRGMTLPLEEALRLEGQLGAPVAASADAQEGILAFNEKRTPHWQGR